MSGVQQWLRDMATDEHEGSLAHKLRSRRFARFEAAADRLPRPLRMLDVGGLVGFWEQRGWAGREGVDITLLNVFPQESPYENVRAVVGDAADLTRWRDGEFDLAFSNSVIEHVGDLERQRMMADEVARVAGAYWVQTPNYFFPVEPHFLMPAWHWLPERSRVAILRRRGVGWADRTPDAAEALELVRSARLLRRSQLAVMFPDAQLVPERFAGLVKSWTAVRGLPL